MKKFLKILGYGADLVLLLVLLMPVLLVGRYCLDLFGVRSYDVPMTQDVENVVQVELVDTETYPHDILLTLTGDEMERFLDDLQKLKTKRYASDPPMPYGEIMVAVYYADGCVDHLGRNMILAFDAAGDYKSTGGMYYFPGDTLEKLFANYVDSGNP